jgi:hypothetical protein
VRVQVDGYGEVMEMKDRFACNSDSKTFRDFGGVYIVGGRYLFYAANKSGANSASMVDLNFTEEWQIRKKEFLSLNPNAKVEEVNLDFRKTEIYDHLEPVDTSLLYEVLLHQENYVSVIENVANKTLKSIQIAQPVLKEHLFAIPSSATLLQFWPQELKESFRGGSFWPVEPEVNRFETNYWMWGHTASHLNDVFSGFGWRLEQEIIVTNVCGEKWDFLLAKYVPE